MPVAVLNTTPENIVFSDPSGKTLAISWGPNNSADGSHIQQVSDELALGNPQFLKAVGLGILEPVSNEAMAEAIQAQAAVYRKTISTEDSAAASMFDMGDKRELVISATAMDAYVESLGKQQKPEPLGDFGG